MSSYRIVKLLSLCGFVVAAGLLVCVVFFIVAVAPLAAKKIDSFDAHVSSPVRLVFTHQGDLLLSDYRSQSVLIIDSSLQGVKSIIEIDGRPSGVDADGALIYVGNETKKSVEVYLRNGKLKGVIADGEIGLPNDIAVDHALGLVFVLDSAAGHIRVFNSKGQELNGIPSVGEAKHLEHPTAIAIDQETRKIYVSDQGPSVNILGFRNRNAFVHVYNYDGSYIDSIRGAFSRPQGLTINPDGYLYLADGVRGQILVFDLLSKSLVKTVGSPGTGPGQLQLPLDVAINVDSGDLWVANNRAGRLEIFEGGGIAP